MSNEIANKKIKFTHMFYINFNYSYYYSHKNNVQYFYSKTNYERKNFIFLSRSNIV